MTSVNGLCPVCKGPSVGRDPGHGGNLFCADGHHYPEYLAIRGLASPSARTLSGYGYCPVCGAEGVSRERRPDGDDKCANGHKYPSRTALTAPVTARPAVSQNGWLEGGWVRRSPQFPIGHTSGFGWLAIYPPSKPLGEQHSCPLSVEKAYDLLVISAESSQNTFRWRWLPIPHPALD